MRVLKFGGSSVSTVERIRAVGEIVQKSFNSSEAGLVIIFSAFGGVTDLIQDMCQRAASGDQSYSALAEEFKSRHTQAALDLLGSPLTEEVGSLLKENHDLLSDFLKGIFLLREVSPRTRDLIWSFGERNSNFIISKYFEAIGLPSVYIDARALVKTNNEYGSAKVNFEESFNRIRKRLSSQDMLYIVTGFIGSDDENITTTLGRGGSDYSASIFAAALEAEELQIWTDVDGVLTTNPKSVSDAFTIPSLSYDEAMELSHFGAKVIYPPTIRPALELQIPILIKNTFNPQANGTKISAVSDENWSGFIKGISSLENISLLTLQGAGMVGVPGVAARLFKAISVAGINIILISQGSSEHSICFAIKSDDALKAKHKIEEEFSTEIQIQQIDPVLIEGELSIIAVVGENMQHIPGVAGRLFQSLGRNGVNVIAIAQGSSELNISFVVHQDDQHKALNLIHDAFFLSGSKHVHLFMVGLGLIGKTLINQIRDHLSHLKNEQQLDFKVIGMANTKKMLFKKGGIDLFAWEEELQQSGQTSNIANFVEHAIKMNLPNSIFVDNTANHLIPEFYEKLIHANIAISTPNKIATSSTYDQYSRLKKLSAERNIPFLYETNVGAGLPILTTLRNLMVSGDRIIKIEGVFSGSLSFIFGKFAGDEVFSEIVKEAKEKGFTEPDPREDLSGADVRRKLTIMGREAGFILEPNAIEVENILPKECLDAGSAEEFLSILPSYDEHYEKLKREAESKGEVLRFIASFQGGKGSIKLESVDADSPFYSLQGGDNMIVFTTDRYQEKPLVVRGPGAGAEVTAAGVLAEVITIANQNYYLYK